ncbi:Smr/MutS family protein [Methylocapsa sp. D3K7]|uniref:Smr/MutS family protein n=1 Tax=Methylocapsa sp. D3K7 TaxID=3041435 RepID=UPI00244EFF87|nr:Smr/MutS family protein [Methylocapsa sp. D3K7]WGJ13958.1 Smr/MutS family protein [Methylocapsa sp. D3K7]
MNENLPPSGKSRLRRLSAEEIELWLNVTKGVARRPGSRLPQPPNAAEPRPRNLDKKPEIAAGKPIATVTGRASPPLPPSPPTLAPLERRLRQKLARGRAAPEAAIDLHGMRRQEAFLALRQFLTHAQIEGARLVLVVTGKGERGALGEGAPGILRQSVPHWLREPAYHAIVVGFEEAQRPHGGAGAFYVRLRRRDRPSRGNAP